MTDFENRYRGGRGHYNNNNNRKRRFRDDDDYDRRPQRRRYEEPAQVKLRRQLLGIAESPLRKAEDDVAGIVKIIVDQSGDETIQKSFLDLVLQLVVEQPFKIPFVAAVVLAANTQKTNTTAQILDRAGSAAQKHLEAGSWRDLKLLLRFLGCLQGLFEADGIFPLLEGLFEKAVALQTASSEDALGLELVKIILLTLPYVLASSATGLNESALSLLDKTDIIASTPHSLEALVNPYPGTAEGAEEEPTSLISLLQKQLQGESTRDWELACIPRAWKIQPQEDGSNPLELAPKHSFPSVVLPETLNPGPNSLFPEIFFSVYADQTVETVPPITNIASSLLRDSLVDTINLLDFNRNATAKFLIDIDSYFAPGTFVKRATQFDRLKEVAGEQSTWKPEDVAVDAVFSQLFQLPAPEHKLVYYHSVLTETCKVAPAAIAPSLGRAIRYLYKNVDSMDMELEYRFMDWFAHHLSNFGFTWKWTEWVDDVELPELHPKKAFMIGALEKEIRLSFANRIRETLPLPYQPLIPKSKDKDVPDFKYNNSETPFAAQAQELLLAIRKKEPDTSIAPILSQITALAAETSYPDPSLPSTDAYITAICFLGSKSLSHVLSLIERCKDRLLSLGHSSPSTRHQIISSVLQYWTPAPGVGVNIIDKLLNYTILTPLSVIEWALVHPDSANEGKELCRSHIFEMLAATTSKVTNRVRQIIKSRDQDGLPPPQVELLQRTLEQERESQKELFGVIESALVGFAAPRGLDAITQEQSDLARLWARRWLAVYRRKISVEDTFLADKMAMPVITAGAGAMAVDGNGENGLNGPNGFGNGSMDVEDGD